MEDSDKRVSWGPLAAIGVTLAIFFVAQILAGLLVAIYPGLRGWSFDQTTQWLDNSVTGQFAFVATVETLSIWMLWQYLKRKKANFASIGLKKPRLRDLGYALLGFVVYFVLYIIVIQVVRMLVPGINLEQKQELGFSTQTSGSMLWLVFISLVILPPLTEEILARGFLYTGLRNGLTKVNAAIVTSILFAAAHLQAGSGNALLWVAAVDTFTLSMVLVYLREKTDSLWASIGVHMLKNGIAFMALFIIKAF